MESVQVMLYALPQGVAVDEHSDEYTQGLYI